TRVGCPVAVTLFPYTTLFRSGLVDDEQVFVFVKDVERDRLGLDLARLRRFERDRHPVAGAQAIPRLVRRPSVYEDPPFVDQAAGDRKSTRLNSSHVKISYAVF